MESKTRLVLENGTDGILNAELVYAFSNGESITMRYQIAKPLPGESSRTIQQLEELMLRKTIDIAQSMLSGLADKDE